MVCRQTISLEMFKKLSSTSFAWSILEYFAPSVHITYGCLSLVIDLFHSNVPFLYPLKTSGFLAFSGSQEIKNWLEVSHKLS